MKFLDFFSGIGGARLGLEMAGHKCIGFCEWDKYARQSYKAMYNTEGEFESYDIRTIKPGDLPRADLWCFGFPCQDISIAGKQKGLEGGERSGLFFEVMRLLAGTKEEDKPRWLLAENVKNLLSIGNGFDFLRLLLEMGNVGYSVQWQMFNTKYSYIVGDKLVHGIPQNRERVFIVGRLIGTKSRQEVFPIPRADGQDNVELQQVGKLTTETRDNPNSYRVYNSLGIAPTLNTMGGGGREPFIIDDQGRYKHHSINNVEEIGYGISKDGKKLQSSHVYNKEGICPTLTTGTGGNQQPLIIDDIGSADGIAPTVMENHGTVTGVVINDETDTNNVK